MTAADALHQQSSHRLSMSGVDNTSPASSTVLLGSSSVSTPGSATPDAAGQNKQRCDEQLTT